MVFSLESLPFRGWLASSPNMSSRKTIEASSRGVQDLSASIKISHDMAINWGEQLLSVATSNGLFAGLLCPSEKYSSCIGGDWGLSLGWQLFRAELRECSLVTNSSPKLLAASQVQGLHLMLSEECTKDAVEILRLNRIQALVTLYQKILKKAGWKLPSMQLGRIFCVFEEVVGVWQDVYILNFTKVNFCSDVDLWGPNLTAHFWLNVRWQYGQYYSICLCYIIGS